MRQTRDRKEAGYRAGEVGLGGAVGALVSNDLAPSALVPPLLLAEHAANGAPEPAIVVTGRIDEP